MNVYQKRIFLMKNTFLRKGIGKQTGGVTPCSRYRSGMKMQFIKKSWTEPFGCFMLMISLSTGFIGTIVICSISWSDHCIYRIFVPDCKVEKIYENPQMSGFSPLSNYAVLFAVPNPENEGKNSETDPSEPPDYFIYHAGKDSQWPLHPEEIGLDSIGGSITRSAREIYQIPAQ